MSDKEFVIEMDDDTEGHGLLNAVEPEDADWLEDRLRRDGGKTNFRITLGDEDDTEGHDAGPTTLRLNLSDDDDTEGHAIAVHFPSRADADAFRRRLLVTGVLVGTVALGAAGGVGLSALQSDAGSAGASAATTQAGQDWDAQRQAQSGYTDPVTQSGQDWEAQRAQQSVGSAATTQAGPMDVHEAPAFQNAGLSDADQAYADRLSGQAAAAQTGPMDVHEAPAFQQSGATSVDADSDIGIMDASGAAAGTDAEGAPSYVDAARNQALQNQANDDDTTPDRKGTAPR